MYTVVTQVTLPMSLVTLLVLSLVILLVLLQVTQPMSLVTLLMSLATLLVLSTVTLLSCHIVCCLSCREQEREKERAELWQKLEALHMKKSPVCTD